MKDKYDVIIVGAGPAGSTAAFFLVNKFNRNVLLIDKAKFPRDKPCGGYLTSRVFKRFNYLCSEIDAIVEVPTYGSYFYGPDLSKLEWIKEIPVGYLVLRTKFDNYLKDLAVSHGVKFIEGSKVVDLLVKEEAAKVVVDNGNTYIADIIIGADGARSEIAKKSKIYEKSDSLNKGLCVVNEFRVSEEFLDEIYGKNRPTHYFYGFENIIGYSWVFPKRTHLNIGIGGPSSSGRELGKKFSKFLNYLREINFLPDSIKLTSRFKAAMIPTSLALYLNRSYSDRVLVVGDALGVVSSVSGEGIYQSMASGEDAAIAANYALTELKFDSSFLQRYEKIWKKDLASELKTFGNIMQLGSSEKKDELLEKMRIFFEKMREERELFDFFTRTFFGMI